MINKSFHIFKDKRPKGFILENVEGLVNHDGGKTLQVIVDRLAALKYNFDFRFVDFANVLRLYKVPFLGYGIGGFRCLARMSVIRLRQSSQREE